MSRPDAVGLTQIMSANVGDRKQIITALWENRRSEGSAPFYGWFFSSQAAVISGPAVIETGVDPVTNADALYINFNGAGTVEVDVYQLGFSDPKRLTIAVT